MPNDTQLSNLTPLDWQEDPRTQIDPKSISYNPGFAKIIPKDLRLPDAQLVILMRVHYANTVLGREPFERELATHYKSLRALIERNMLLEVGRHQYKILEKGLTALCAWQTKQKVNVAIARKVLMGEKRSDVNSEFRNREPSPDPLRIGRIPLEKAERFKNLIYSLLDGRGVEHIMRAYPQADTASLAISLFISDRRALIEDCVKGITIESVLTKKVGAVRKDGFTNYTIVLNCRYLTYGDVYPIEVTFGG